MYRFYLAPNDWASATLEGSEAHHARDVLRLQPGDRLTIFDGRGREALAEIEALRSEEIALCILQETVMPPLRAQIALAQAIPKGKNMDLIVQKAVEIGATEIIPLLSDRTVIHLESKSAAQKQAKWQLVAIEAAKQCGQDWLPEVHLPRLPKAFFRDLASNGTAHDLRLIGSLQPGARHLKNILDEYAQAHAGARPARVLVLIGPEGDFTPAEIALARSYGCLPLTLGPVILRVETAAIYALSILSYEVLQDP